MATEAEPETLTCRCTTAILHNVQGDEASRVAAFKECLGLSDEDAAPVHIEVGRRFMREGFETKDRNAVFEKRKVRRQGY